MIFKDHRIVHFCLSIYRLITDKSSRTIAKGDMSPMTRPYRITTIFCQSKLKRALKIHTQFLRNELLGHTSDRRNFSPFETRNIIFHLSSKTMCEERTKVFTSSRATNVPFKVHSQHPKCPHLSSAAFHGHACMHRQSSWTMQYTFTVTRKRTTMFTIHRRKWPT